MPIVTHGFVNNCRFNGVKIQYCFFRIVLTYEKNGQSELSKNLDQVIIPGRGVRTKISYV